MIKRLLANPTVEGIILANDEGHIQYTSLDNNITFFISSKLLSFGHLVRSTVRDIDPSDDLLTFRLRTRNKEMMIVTPNNGTQAIAIQKINSSINQQYENKSDESLFTTKSPTQ